MKGQDGNEMHTYVNANSIPDETNAEPRMLYLIADLSEQELLRKEAHHDALTGLYTRGYFLDLLSTNISLSQRHQRPLSLCLCLCDLDNFKQVNDTYGHRLGDRVLETFTWVISQEIRNEDIAARIGGDEFIITFPQIEGVTSATCMERIRKRFESISFKTEGGQDFTCTVNLGLADHPQTPISEEELIELADKSLYHAKELGRNCTVANMHKFEKPAA
jgi:diguanylate cyclase (GGDEF)-like protein